MLRLVEGDFFMKRLLSVILVLCMVLGLASPAGSGLFTEIKANTTQQYRSCRQTDGERVRRIGKL